MTYFRRGNDALCIEYVGKENRMSSIVILIFIPSKLPFRTYNANVMRFSIIAAIHYLYLLSDGMAFNEEGNTFYKEHLII